MEDQDTRATSWFVYVVGVVVFGGLLLGTVLNTQPMMMIFGWVGAVVVDQGLPVPSGARNLRYRSMVFYLLAVLLAIGVNAFVVQQMGAEGFWASQLVAAVVGFVIATVIDLTWPVPVAGQPARRAA